MVLVLGATLALVGCGNKVETRTVGETEGLYIDVGDLKYQVQISRIINPYDVEDRNYLRGLPAGTLPPKADEAWFGVWLRVQNNSSARTFDTAADFEIVDTQENRYEPIDFGFEDNVVRLQRRGRSGPRRSCRTSRNPLARGRSRARCCCSSSPTTRCRTGRSSSRSPARRTPTNVGIVDLDV